MADRSRQKQPGFKGSPHLWSPSNPLGLAGLSFLLEFRGLGGSSWLGSMCVGRANSAWFFSKHSKLCGVACPPPHVWPPRLWCLFSTLPLPLDASLLHRWVNSEAWKEGWGSKVTGRTSC